MAKIRQIKYGAFTPSKILFSDGTACHRVYAGITPVWWDDDDFRFSISPNILSVPSDRTVNEITVISDKNEGNDPVSYTAMPQETWINVLNEGTTVIADADTLRREGAIETVVSSSEDVITVVAKGGEVNLPIFECVWTNPVRTGSVVYTQLGESSNAPITLQISQEGSVGNTTYTLSTDTSWLHVNEENNTVSADANNGGERNDGSITVTSADGTSSITIPVKQIGNEVVLEDCIFEVTPTTVSCDAAGKVQSFTVNSKVAYTNGEILEGVYSSTPHDTWLTKVSNADYEITPNEGGERNSIIVFTQTESGKEVIVTVTQTEDRWLQVNEFGENTGSQFVVTPSQTDFNKDGGRATFVVNSKLVYLSGKTENVAYTSSTDSSWIQKIDEASYTVTSNEDTTRTGVITFVQSVTNETKTFEIVQGNGAYAIFRVNDNNGNFQLPSYTASENELVLVVTSETNGDIPLSYDSVVSNGSTDWIVKTDNVHYTIKPNTDLVNGREGTITFTQESYLGESPKVIVVTVKQNADEKIFPEIVVDDETEYVIFTNDTWYPTYNTSVPKTFDVTSYKLNTYKYVSGQTIQDETRIDVDYTLNVFGSTEPFVTVQGKTLYISNNNTFEERSFTVKFIQTEGSHKSTTVTVTQTPPVPVPIFTVNGYNTSFTYQPNLSSAKQSIEVVVESKMTDGSTPADLVWDVYTSTDWLSFDKETMSITVTANTSKSPRPDGTIVFTQTNKGVSSNTLVMTIKQNGDIIDNTIQPLYNLDVTPKTIIIDGTGGYTGLLDIKSTIVYTYISGAIETLPYSLDNVTAESSESWLTKRDNSINEYVAQANDNFDSRNATVTFTQKKDDGTVLNTSTVSIVQAGKIPVAEFSVNGYTDDFTITVNATSGKIKPTIVSKLSNGVTIPYTLSVYDSDWMREGDNIVETPYDANYSLTDSRSNSIVYSQTYNGETKSITVTVTQTPDEPSYVSGTAYIIDYKGDQMFPSSSECSRTFTTEDGVTSYKTESIKYISGRVVTGPRIDVDYTLGAEDEEGGEVDFVTIDNDTLTVTVSANDTIYPRNFFLLFIQEGGDSSKSARYSFIQPAHEDDIVDTEYAFEVKLLPTEVNAGQYFNEFTIESSKTEYYRSGNAIKLNLQYDVEGIDSNIISFTQLGNAKYVRIMPFNDITATEPRVIEGVFQQHESGSEIPFTIRQNPPVPDTSKTPRNIDYRFYIDTPTVKNKIVSVNASPQTIATDGIVSLCNVERYFTDGSWHKTDIDQVVPYSCNQNNDSYHAYSNGQSIVVKGNETNALCSDTLLYTQNESTKTVSWIINQEPDEVVPPIVPVANDYDIVINPTSLNFKVDGTPINANENTFSVQTLKKTTYERTWLSGKVDTIIGDWTDDDNGYTVSSIPSYVHITSSEGINTVVLDSNAASLAPREANITFTSKNDSSKEVTLKVSQAGGSIEVHTEYGITCDINSHNFGVNGGTEHFDVKVLSRTYNFNASSNTRIRGSETSWVVTSLTDWKTTVSDNRFTVADASNSVTAQSNAKSTNGIANVSLIFTLDPNIGEIATDNDSYTITLSQDADVPTQTPIFSSSKTTITLDTAAATTLSDWSFVTSVIRTTWASGAEGTNETVDFVIKGFANKEVAINANNDTTEKRETLTLSQIGTSTEDIDIIVIQPGRTITSTQRDTTRTRVLIENNDSDYTYPTKVSASAQKIYVNVIPQHEIEWLYDDGAYYDQTWVNSPSDNLIYELGQGASSYSSDENGSYIEIDSNASASEREIKVLFKNRLYTSLNSGNTLTINQNNKEKTDTLRYVDIHFDPIPSKSFTAAGEEGVTLQINCYGTRQYLWSDGNYYDDQVVKLDVNLYSNTNDSLVKVVKTSKATDTTNASFYLNVKPNISTVPLVIRLEFITIEDVTQVLYVMMDEDYITGTIPTGDYRVLIDGIPSDLTIEIDSASAGTTNVSIRLEEEVQYEWESGDLTDGGWQTSTAIPFTRTTDDISWTDGVLSYGANHETTIVERTLYVRHPDDIDANAKSITILQNGRVATDEYKYGDCSITVSPSEATYTAKGGRKQLVVVSQGYRYEKFTDGEWYKNTTVEDIPFSYRTSFPTTNRWAINNVVGADNMFMLSVSQKTKEDNREGVGTVTFTQLVRDDNADTYAQVQGVYTQEACVPTTETMLTDYILKVQTSWNNEWYDTDFSQTLEYNVYASSPFVFKVESTALKKVVYTNGVAYAEGRENVVYTVTQPAEQSLLSRITVNDEGFNVAFPRNNTTSQVQRVSYKITTVEREFEVTLFIDVNPDKIVNTDTYHQITLDTTTWEINAALQTTSFSDLGLTAFSVTTTTTVTGEVNETTEHTFPSVLNNTSEDWISVNGLKREISVSANNSTTPRTGYIQFVHPSTLSDAQPITQTLTIQQAGREMVSPQETIVIDWRVLVNNSTEAATIMIDPRVGTAYTPEINAQHKVKYLYTDGVYYASENEESDWIDGDEIGYTSEYALDLVTHLFDTPSPDYGIVRVGNQFLLQMYNGQTPTDLKYKLDVYNKTYDTNQSRLTRLVIGTKPKTVESQDDVVYRLNLVTPSTTSLGTFNGSYTNNVEITVDSFTEQKTYYNDGTIAMVRISDNPVEVVSTQTELFSSSVSGNKVAITIFPSSVGGIGSFTLVNSASKNAPSTQTTQARKTFNFQVIPPTPTPKQVTITLANAYGDTLGEGAYVSKGEGLAIGADNGKALVTETVEMMTGDTFTITHSQNYLIITTQGQSYVRSTHSTPGSTSYVFLGESDCDITFIVKYKVPVLRVETEPYGTISFGYNTPYYHRASKGDKEVIYFTSTPSGTYIRNGSTIKSAIGASKNAIVAPTFFNINTTTNVGISWEDPTKDANITFSFV